MELDVGRLAILSERLSRDTPVSVAIRHGSIYDLVRELAEEDFSSKLPIFGILFNICSERFVSIYAINKRKIL